MENMSGGNLATQMKIKKQLPEDQVKFYAAEITSGLLFLHNRDIIHL